MRVEISREYERLYWAELGQDECGFCKHSRAAHTETNNGYEKDEIGKVFQLRRECSSKVLCKCSGFVDTLFDDVVEMRMEVGG